MNRTEFRQESGDGRIHFVGNVFFERKQSGFDRFQLGLHFCHPGRMGKIPGSNYGNAFDPGCLVNVLQIQVPGRGPGIF